MRYLIIFLTVFVSVNYLSCTGQYDNVDEFAGEVVYPARFDTIIGRIGFERVELELMKAGRIPSSKINLGKASKTVIECGSQKWVFDSVCSWVNIPDLKDSKLYRFKAYTIDDYGNMSVPQEIALIPFTAQDRDLVGVASPKLLVSPHSLIAEWPNGLNSVVMDYKSLSYNYVDKDGIARKDSTFGTRFFCSNLAPGAEVTINVNFKVIPILSDGSKVLDTVIVSKPIVVIMSTPETSFSPSEAVSLRANGITSFTSAAVQSIKKLTFPLHTGTFMDLFYFPSLEYLDLTGEGLDKILPTLVYKGNTVTSQCGGGVWQPFMIRVEKPKDLKISGLDMLKDLLESGQLKKVRYIPNSMGLDKLLEPYIASGVVEFVKDNDPIYPESVFVHPQCFVNGQVQANDWEILNYYSGDYLPRQGFSDVLGNFNPNNQIVNGDPIDLQLNQLIESDGKNIYKCIVRKRSASFAMCLPKEYMFDSKRYRYLKFKMFCGSSVTTMTGSYSTFLRPWIRPMNHMWAFGGNSIYGQGYWAVDLPEISKAEIRSKWKEYVVDMNANNYWENDNTSDRRNRVIVFNIGHEPSGELDYKENDQIVIYFADIRFSKTQ